MTAAMNVGGLNVACVWFPRNPSERIACSCNFTDCTSLQWTSNATKVVLRSNGLLYHRPTRRKRCLNTVSYQGVAENGAEGNDATPSSSTPTLDWQKRERLWHHLQGSLQHWKQELKDRGSLQIAKELLASTETRLKNAEANQILKQKLQKLKPPQPSTLWSGVHPSIKWPVVTFGVFYLAVTISCGKAVSDNLWRVWIIGPLAMSFYIQAGIYAGGLYRKHGAPQAEVLVRRGTELVSDMRSGKFQQDVQSGIKRVAAQTPAAAQYLKSKASTDVKDWLIRFAMWLYEKYEDVIDLLWPSWRIFIRFLANLF